MSPLSAIVRVVFKFREADISHQQVGPRIDGFPPHDPDFPDVDPATGDERETTDAA